MAQPTQLTPTEQDALVKQIGLAMLRVAPDDWEQLTVDYRAVGRYAESTGQVIFTDGSSESWEMPADLRGLFARLRGGMYREGRGTWFNARYRLDHPSSYNLEYDREEPNWDLQPPPQAYPDDMRLFPRTDENVPEWLRRRLASAPPPPGGPPPGGPERPPGPRFRVARIFDGPGEDGRPSVNRPHVDEIEIQDVLDYLDGAPLVGPARGYDVDRLDPNGQQSVPVAFHTDGTWIWPAAVNYFLREHDISPETDLVDHIRRMRFKLPHVDEQAVAAAQQFLGPPPGPGPRPGPPSPGPTRALPVPSPAPAPAPPAPKAPATPPRAALPSQGPPSQQLDQLRARLDDLDVPDTAYRIGAPAGRGWVMEQADDGWRVGWYDRDWVAPAMFEDVADASAFLLGKLMLDTDRWAAGPRNPELPAMSSPAPLAPEDHGFEPLSAPVDAFEPMAAPIDDYGSPAPSSAHAAADEFPPPGRSSAHAADEFTPPGRSSGPPPPAGPVLPPPGTPGYSSPPGSRYEPSYPDAPARFSDSSGFSEPTFSEPIGTSRHAESPGFTEPGYSEPGYSESSDGFAPPAGPPPGTPPRPQPTMAMEPGDPLSRGFEPPGLEPSGHGLDSPGHGLDTPGRGFDGPGRGLDGPGHGLDSPGRGLDGPGRGLDSPGRGLDGPGHGLDSPGRGLDSPPRGVESRGAEATVLASRPTNGAAAAAPGSEWPIKPLPGEPPLTLFRGKRVIELEPGMEIDRYGDDDGNLVYAAGTPFAERSLVPEWIDRPYHAYRVRQPVQVLSGAAIPWFDQPGGGTAFLLPDAVGDLVAHGHLVEINDRERPPA